MINVLATLALLIGLELVLGVDNVLVISLLVNKLPKNDQSRARKLGLTLALVCRLLMLLGASTLVKMREPVLMSLSWRDMLLIGGGLFLLYKAVVEIHHTVEGVGAHEIQLKKTSFSSSIVQIIMLDIVFSLDSVVTAVGMTDHLWVIMASVLVSFAIVLFFAKRIGDFIIENPGLKILALSFLVTIGVTLFMEGMHTEIPKAYIYLPMGFALVVEALQMRFSKNTRKAKKVEKGV